MKNRHMLWIVELFIWLLILFAVSGVIMLARYNHRKDFNTYQIFLPDVDGLINGSPVRFMGIQVGYVNQIDIVGNDVYVKFIVTDPNVKLPPGAIATVEFTGLGGSKSLELYPPKPNAQSRKLIVAQSPKRIHDSLGLLNQMYDQIVEITYVCSHFMNEIGLIKKENGKIKSMQSANEFLEYSDNWLNQTQIKYDNVSKKLNGKNKKDKKDEEHD